ncbi:MAG TPA: sialidase family protein [Candidatus Dormibacteraeota bacterium]|jgi:hypothetical protein|nr:sialidase family protein [Candidatus Dormibacteraeota bacterium]
MNSKTATALSLALVITILVPGVAHGTKALSFNNIVLLRPDGDSEPELSISQTGQVALVGLSWTLFQTNAWEGSFGQTPTFQGAIDSMIQTGVGGGEDADVDFGSTGTIHVTTLLAVFNPNTRITQLGVSAITCPHGDMSNNFANCTRQIIDFTQADRPWITSDGPHVWISYHDSGSSTLIHVWRSDDDGFTWKTVGDPIPGQGATSGNSTFNNDQGKIVADPVTHNVYDIYAAGVSGVQKGTSANFNNIYVSVSSDFGNTWTPHLVFSAPVNQPLNNIFPVLGVDPSSGAVYAGWSNLHNVFVSKSVNQASTWSAPVGVASSPVNTALMPWVAVRGQTVDVTYYGTSSQSNTDSSAVWNTYLSQSIDGGSHFTQSLISAHPNHVGDVCTGGISCASGTRNLLDLFQIAIDPVNSLAAIIFTDDTITTQSNGAPLPQVIVAYQN